MNRQLIIIYLIFHKKADYIFLDIFTNNLNYNDKCNKCLNLKEWHEILGHCNIDDIVDLENVVKGMKIKDRHNTSRSKFECNVCKQGKFVNIRNRAPDARATTPLELVHTDLAGPVNVTTAGNFNYVITFTDDFSSTIFVYFLKNKSDATTATEKFLADCAPYGNVKCIRSDNGGEYIGSDFKTLLRERGIKHETSCPYSPHQVGTAERNWRTLFEMARCLLIQSGLPKTLWPYAIRMSVFIRNRCFNKRIRDTPYFVLTGRKPNLSKMAVFGSKCYAYQNNVHNKLDSKCIYFYLVFHSDSKKRYKT